MTEPAACVSQHITYFPFPRSQLTVAVQSSYQRPAAGQTQLSTMRMA